MKIISKFKDRAQGALSFSPLFKRGFIGSAISSAAQITSTAMTNASNQSIANATNASNRQIARETNEANIQMNTANNQLQQQLQQEMNEYNSIGSQLQRAADAGVNPNAVLGGDVSGNLQTTLPSTQAGHAEMGAPNQFIPMQNPMQGAIDAFKSYFEAMKTKEDTSLVQSQKEYQDTINKYQDALSQAGLKVSDAQARYFYSSSELMAEQVKTIDAQVQKINSEIGNLDAQTALLNIDKYYKSDMYENHIKLLKSQSGYNDAQAKYAIGVLPSVVGMNTAIAGNQRAQSELAKAQKLLSESEKARVDEDVKGLSIRNGIDALNFMISSDKEVLNADKTNRKLSPKVTQQTIDNLDYVNSRTNRVIQGFRDVTVGVGAAVVAGAQAKKAFGKPSASSSKQYFSNSTEFQPTYW